MTKERIARPTEEQKQAIKASNVRLQNRVDVARLDNIKKGSAYQKALMEGVEYGVSVANDFTEEETSKKRFEYAMYHDAYEWGKRLGKEFASKNPESYPPSFQGIKDFKQQKLQENPITAEQEEAIKPLLGNNQKLQAYDKGLVAEHKRLLNQDEKAEEKRKRRAFEKPITKAEAGIMVGVLGGSYGTLFAFATVMIISAFVPIATPILFAAVGAGMLAGAAVGAGAGLKVASDQKELANAYKAGKTHAKENTLAVVKEKSPAKGKVRTHDLVEDVAKGQLVSPNKSPKKERSNVIGLN